MTKSNNKKKTKKTTFEISLKLDKDFIRMLKTSKITQIPIKFFEDNIEKMYINDKEISPYMIQEVLQHLWNLLTLKLVKKYTKIFHLTLN